MEAKLILHHDDPPCNLRLVNGYCVVCKYVPDMQSTCLYCYCPSCDTKLVSMICPTCLTKFENPL